MIDMRCSKRGTMSNEIDMCYEGEFPKLVTASSLTKATGIPESDILEYAKLGLIPHVVLCGKAVMFSKKIAIEWLKENAASVCNGRSLNPVPVFLEQAASLDVPKQLAMVADRLVKVNRICGVYFLVKNGEVVYVGQSSDIGSRLKQHDVLKPHDYALAIPCPESELDALESAFIGMIKPALNMFKNGRDFCVPSRGFFVNPQKAIKQLNQETPVNS